MPTPEEFDDDCGTMWVTAGAFQEWQWEDRVADAGYFQHHRVEAGADWEGYPALVDEMEFGMLEGGRATSYFYLRCDAGDVYLRGAERSDADTVEGCEAYMEGASVHDPPLRVWSDRGFSEGTWRSAGVERVEVWVYSACEEEPLAYDTQSELYDDEFEVLGEETVNVPALGEVAAWHIQYTFRDAMVSHAWILPGLPAIQGEGFGFPYYPGYFSLVSLGPGEE